MKIPSKFISYKNSSLHSIPDILEPLKEKDLSVFELYRKVKSKVGGVNEFLEILTLLYALEKITMIEEVIHLC